MRKHAEGAAERGDDAGPGAAERPAAMEYTAPVPGVVTTTRVVTKKAVLNGQTSTFGR
jgi:hypothetical protein